MALAQKFNEAEFDKESVFCRACGWKGKGAACKKQVRDYCRCPGCNAPVEREDDGPRQHLR